MRNLQVIGHNLVHVFPILISKRAKWSNHNDLKADFPSADYVSNNSYVFNIKGNNYRIIVVVVFFAGELNVRFAGTHAEYDKIDAKKI